MADEQQVTMSERLWSEEVGIAEAGSLPTKTIGYQFSGRTFEDGKGAYAEPATP